MLENSRRPKISVVITTHNRAQLLGRAIDSVLKQTYENFELVIVDDCSHDNTTSVVESYLSEYPSIKYIKNEKNLGAPASRNIGVKEASGLYITGLDDDDEFTPNRLELFVNNYRAEWSFICTGFYYHKNKKLMPIRNYQETISLNDMLFSNRASNHGFLPRSRYLSINGQDLDLVACEDYDFWLRMVESFGPAKRLAEPTYIIYDDHELDRITNSPNELIGLKQVIKKHQHKMSAEQYKSQRLNLYIKKKEPLPLNKLFELISTTIIWKATKYYLTSNFRFMVGIEQKLHMLKARQYK